MQAETLYFVPLPHPNLSMLLEGDMDLLLSSILAKRQLKEGKESTVVEKGLRVVYLDTEDQ